MFSQDWDFTSTLFLNNHKVTSVEKEQRIWDATLEIIAELESTALCKILKIDIVYIIDINNQLWIIKWLDIKLSGEENINPQDLETLSICFSSSQFPNSHKANTYRKSKVESLPSISTLNQRIPLEFRAMKRNAVISPQGRNARIEHHLNQKLYKSQLSVLDGKF